MKKIMFNSKYGLTQAVLERRKTQTRRFIPNEVFAMETKYRDGILFIGKSSLWGYTDIRKTKYARYNVGEVVAIAQAYNDFYNDECDPRMFPSGAGWTNNIFVRADLMPHHIRITDIRVELLQYISDNDCIKEGVFMDGGDDAYVPKYFYDYPNNRGDGFDTPREAYAALIDKVSGKGTWQSNPFVFVYEFELVK